ncbi:hypothetical protein Tsubulata_046945 [Turnera subulata]|uniref:Uncharacterized protein n=1 Tax=Turnera subulata TaxID=218843 RepID=A0A9Q0GIF3_9ROSI|nr:hypothetical protein Tsubulata_046945 [Turnera subulata]
MRIIEADGRPKDVGIGVFRLYCSGCKDDEEEEEDGEDEQQQHSWVFFKHLFKHDAKQQSLLALRGKPKAVCRIRIS